MKTHRGGKSFDLPSMYVQNIKTAREAHGMAFMVDSYGLKDRHV